MTVSVDATTREATDGVQAADSSAPGTLEDAFIAQCEADYTLAEITAIAHAGPGKSPTHVLAVVELLHEHLEPNPLIGLPPESDGYPRRIDLGARGGKLLVQRWHLPVRAGIQWYRACANGSMSVPGKDASKPTVVPLQQLGDDPPWPHLVVELDKFWEFSEFWGDRPGGSRWHRLLPLAPIDITSGWQAADFEKARDFLMSEVHVDIVSRSVLLGSCHLRLPNPVFRDLHQRVGSDLRSVTFDLELHPDQSLDELELTFWNQRSWGATSVRRMALQLGLNVLPVPEGVGQVAHAVSCRKRGLLNQSESAGFIGAINMTMNLVSEQRRVETPKSEILLEEESKARERGVSSYFWGHYAELPLNETSLVRLILVARRGWADIATQADALPLRAFRDWLWLGLHLDDDRESILSLLRAAPPVFASDAWTRSTSALAALRAAVRHAEKLQEHLVQAARCSSPAPDAGAKLRALEEQELPAWLREVAETAFARSDGRVLFILFASSLVRHDLSWNGQRSWPASRHALSAVYGALNPKPSLAECQQTASMGGVPSRRTTIDLATYLITSAVFDVDPKLVWGWYRELLLKNDDDLCWQARSCQRRAVCYFALAERLGQLPDPFGEWRGVWKALFVTDRERARFATLDQNAQYPSLHLLRVGAELLRQAPSRGGAWRFFEESLDYTRTLLENCVRRFNPIEPEIALDVLDVAVRIPGCDWRTLVGQYPTLLSIATNRIYVSAVLLEAGASFGEVELAIELAPHRLLDTVAELRNDISVHHLCEFVSEAAKRHERKQSEEASAP